MEPKDKATQQIKKKKEKKKYTSFTFLEAT